MKIYAVRDRLIDYFMQPFIGPGDKQVLAALAKTVNSGETSDIQQAPHHFELWTLGQVTDDGHVVPERELIADCASLIRGDLRERRLANAQAVERDLRAQQEGAGGGRGTRGTDGAPLPDAAQAASQALEEVPPGPRGGYPPREH